MNADLTIAPRRLLPSLSLLAAFEAVCRWGSTARAARELALTQGAISRLVQNLEDQLQVQLFRRERNRLIPTDAALAYAQNIKKALDLITSSSLRLRACPSGNVLSLAILPTFGTRWLAPRLGKFLAQHPDISVNLGTRMTRFNFEHEQFDAAIHFGSEDWLEADHIKLFDERMVACCSPSFQRQNPIEAPADLARLPLLHNDSRPSAWSAWFAHQGLGNMAAQGMLFDQYSTILQAAFHGLGVALLPAFLASTEIDAGRLVALDGAAFSGVGAYYLVWPRSRPVSRPLQAFRDWLPAATAELRQPPCQSHAHTIAQAPDQESVGASPAMPQMPSRHRPILRPRP